MNLFAHKQEFIKFLISRNYNKQPPDVVAYFDTEKHGCVVRVHVDTVIAFFDVNIEPPRTIDYDHYATQNKINYVTKQSVHSIDNILIREFFVE